MIDPETLDSKIVQQHVKYIQDHLDYLVAIHKGEDADFEGGPTRITLTFSFVKKKDGVDA